VIWGGIHGFFLVFAAFTQGIRNRVHQAMGLNRVPKLQKTLKGLITFFLVCFAWIFFRANNISDGLYIVSHLWTGWGGFYAGALVPFEGVLKFNLVIGVVSTVILLITHFLQGEDYFSHWLSQKRMVWRWSIYYSMILAILLFGPSQSKEFIYFQF
jgi:hypothetical protein